VLDRSAEDELKQIARVRLASIQFDQKQYDDALRTLGSLVLLEASAALDPTFRNTPPDAMLSIQVLREGSAFLPSDFLKGEAPPPEEVALAQTLVNAP